MKRLLPLILAAWLAGIGGTWAQQVFYLSGLQPAHGGGALSGTDTTFWCDKNTGSPPGCGASDPLKQVTLQQIENFVFFGLSGIPPISYGSSMGAIGLNFDSTLSVVGGQLHVVSAGGGPTIPNAALLSGNGTSIGGVTLGTGLSITGSFPNQTLNAAGGGGGSGTVGTGVGPQIAQYPSGTGTAVAGVTVSGDANLAIGGVLTINPLAVTAGKLASGAAASNIGALSGDLTGSLPSPTIASGAVTSAKIGTGQVTYSNIQNVAASRLLGNPTGGAAAPSEISLGTGLSFVGNVLNAALPIPAAGSANAIQYNSGGTLGGFGPVASAVAITNAAGVPSESTTLPSGLTIPTATVTSPAITGGTIVSLPNPTNPQDAATKAYVDAAASSGVSHPSVQAATTAALSGTWTYANGTAGVGATLTAPAGTTTLTLDGYVVVNGDRVLIKDQGATNGFQNGPYTAAISGSPVVLTRVTDMNQAAAGSMALGAFMNVNNGTVNGSSQWGLGAPTPASITMGTTILTFNKLSSANTYAADGTSLKLTGNVFSANLIPPAAGGTGVANTNTITLGGNLVTGGAFATSGGFGLTLTLTGATNVTLPVSGTLLANARLINTTAPLTGGGDLTTDRTLALSGPSNLTTFTANTIPKGAGTSPFAASSLTDNGTTVSTTENFSAVAGAFTGNLTTNITGGSTQCVHVNTAGVLSGVGAGLDCGVGTVFTGTAPAAAYYATSTNAVSGNPNVSYQSGFARFNYMTTPGAVPTPLSGTDFQLAGSDANPTRFESDAFGAPARFDGVCYGGTSSSLAAVGSGVVCGGFEVFAYNGSTAIGPLGGIKMTTTQAQASGAGGMQTAVQTVANNSTTVQDTLIAGQDGSLTVLNQAGTGTRCVHADSTGKQSTTASDCFGVDSVSAGLTAAGTAQGSCLNLTSQQNYIGTVAAGTGVCLPAAATGIHAFVCNEGANPLSVYAPAGGTTINSLSSIGLVPVAVDTCMQFIGKSSSAWRSVP